MSRVLGLVRGFPGHPLHPPLTDAAIGAYTVGVAMLVAGALGVEEEQMAHGALLAVAGGLIVTVPTALTGLLDWWQIPKGTPARTAATLHLVIMVLATALFALTFALQLDGYRSDEVTTGAWIAGLGALALLAGGGYIGGTLVFVYRVRVLGRADTPLREAMIPRPEREQAAEPAAQAGEMARGRGG